MPLILSTEEMFDMPFGPVEGEKHIPHWLANICYAVVGLAMKVVSRYSVVNRQAIRSFDGKGVVVVGNHVSYLDPVFLWLSIRPSQYPRFMARDNIFRGVLGYIGAHCGAFPVKRDTADLTSVKRAAKMLKRGEPVGIFPEGTRRGKGSVEPELHAGAAMIARMGRAPLLPATARNADKIKQKGKMLRFQKVEVVFGEPVYLEWFDFLPKELRLEGCSWYVMRECFALARDVAPEEVDMTQMFPDAHDFTPDFAGVDVRGQASSEVAVRVTQADQSSQGDQGAQGDQEKGHDLS